MEEPTTAVATKALNITEKRPMKWRKQQLIKVSGMTQAQLINARYSECKAKKVQCDRCGASVSQGSSSMHKLTSKCLNLETPKVFNAQDWHETYT
eukprot:5645021-Heterocapsa_arctica.AAC.1